MRIVVLLENTKPKQRSLRVHHGLSLYVEWKGKKILFDTGQNYSFAKNARLLEVDLKEIDYCVISHAHYDHGGGLKGFFRHNSHAPVFLKTSCKEKYYARITGNTYKSIGLNEKLFDRFEDRFTFIKDRSVPSPGILLLSPSDFNTFRPQGNSRLFMHRENKYLEDIFDHELMMVLHDEQSLVLFTGCAHSGILNMIRTVQQEFPGRKITAVLGGFHLMLQKKGRPGESEEIIRSVGSALADQDIPEIYTGHCTSGEAFTILSSVLGTRLKRLETGLEIADMQAM